jgi:hypothetical protein
LPELEAFYEWGLPGMLGAGVGTWEGLSDSTDLQRAVTVRLATSWPILKINEILISLRRLKIF